MNIYVTFREGRCQAVVSVNEHDDRDEITAVITHVESCKEGEWTTAPYAIRAEVRDQHVAFKACAIAAFKAGRKRVAL